MSKPPSVPFATDKDIFDLLQASKQRLTSSVLLELARDRGIYYSHREERDKLVDCLSVLTHDFHDVVGMIKRGEPSRRSERVATVTLSEEVTQAELKDAIAKYHEMNPRDDVSSRKQGTTDVLLNVGYEDTEYSKTRLLQKTPRDAEISFSNEGGVTVARLPATEKSRKVVEQIKRILSETSRPSITTSEIQASHLVSPQARTAFFTELITQIAGHKLQTVTRVRVAKLNDINPSTDDIDVEIEEHKAIEQEMLGVVKHVALAGDNLVASSMFQDLMEKGFFVTAISWRVVRIDMPRHIAALEAGFEGKAAGTGFKYGVAGITAFANGTYNKSPRPPTDEERRQLLRLIETAAKTSLTNADGLDKSLMEGG
jgi:hypothetical protein